MTDSTWCKAGTIDPKMLGEARIQAHYATQWLARIARAFIDSEPDDSHYSLSWLSESHALCTQPLSNGATFGLIISELSLFCIEPDGTVSELSLDGKSDDEAGHWVKDQLEFLGFDSQLIDAPLPYTLAPHPLSDDGSYDTIDSAMALRELALWYDSAHDMISVICEEMIKRSFRTSPIRCWPHHFDMAALIPVDTDSTEVEPVIGVGMSPGDEYYGQPYYYVSPWPYLKPQALPDLPFVGHWHVKGFVGAVALGSRIIELDGREKALRSFLLEAISIGREKLAIQVHHK